MKSIRMAAAAGALLAGAWLAVPAPASTGSVPGRIDVPCSTSALIQDLDDVLSGSGGGLSLASHCTYVLTSGGILVRSEQGLFLDGNGATLERSYAPGTPQFPLLTVYSPADPNADAFTTDLNFRNAYVAIKNEGGGLEVHGGTFSGNGTAISTNNGASVTGASFIKNTDHAIIASSLLNVKNCVFTRNTGANGGAIYGDEADLEITGSTFRYNRATSQGGAIASIDSDLDVSHSSFTANTAASAGGAIAAGDETATITGSSFHRNSAPVGGGIAGAYPLFLTKTTVSRNTASQFGGGLAIGGQADITNSWVKDNTAATDGGGIYAYSRGSVTLTGSSSITGNLPDNCAPPGTITGCTG